MQRFLIFGATLLLTLATGAAYAAGDAPQKRHDWGWVGHFGTFDRAAAQRGLQVYREVCAACHSLDRIRFRDLSGIGYSLDDIQSFAKADYTIMDGPDDDGEYFERPALPKDSFPAPFANEQQARSVNNGAYPPDLSLIIKARNIPSPNLLTNFVDALSARDSAGGADYTYNLLSGYENSPADYVMMEGMHYNNYFSGRQIAMAPPLSDGGIEYEDGTNATAEQQARDVVTFLAWASEPELEIRRKFGIQVMGFLAVFLILLIATKRRVWKHIK